MTGPLNEVLSKQSLTAIIADPMVSMVLARSFLSCIVAVPTFCKMDDSIGMN